MIEDSYQVFDSRVTIHYAEGTSGWTSPTWTAPDGSVYNTAVIKDEVPLTGPLSELTSVDYLAFAALAERPCTIGQTVREILADEWEQPWDKTDVLTKDLFARIQNWTVLSVQPYSKKGFYGVAFANEDGEAVLALRGEDGGHWNSYFNSTHWEPASFKKHFGAEADQIERAFAFYESVSSMDSVRDIAVCGHSMGGALAEILSARYRLSGESFNAVPFLEIAYVQYAAAMAESFTGIDSFRFVAHANEKDAVGNWKYESVRDRQLHTHLGGNSHELFSFLTVDGEGKPVLTPLVNEASEDGFGAVAVNPSCTVALGTTGNDVFKGKVIDRASHLYLFGGDGNDSIYGGDVISGGRGNDTIDGSFFTRNTTYVYYKGDGVDTILDVDGQDALLLCGFDESDTITIAGTPEDEYIQIRCNHETIINLKNDRSHFGGSFTVTGETIPETELLSLMKSKQYSHEYTISCPVDIEILDANGNVVYTVKDAEEGAYYTEYGNFYVYREENGEYGKFLRMIEGYTVRIVGVGEGTMDVQVQAAADDGSLLPVQSLEAVPVTTTTTATVEKDTQNNASLHVDTDGDSQTDSTLTLTYTLESNASSALTFTEDGYVKGISAGLTAADLAACFATEAIRITDSNGVVLASDADLKTLYRIELLAEDGKTVLDEATILVTCDINCDGESNVLDLLRTRQLIENNEITDWEKMIADLNESGAPDVYDLIDMIKTILA